MRKRKNKKLRISKRILWLKNFLNDHNPSTFLNKTESAAQANYKNTSRQYLSEIGSRNASFYKAEIAKWLDDFGMSDDTLKIKLLSLIEAKETKFFQKDGKVTDSRDVESLEVQRRSLDMALKVKGLYAPEKKELTGKDGGPIETKMTDFPKEPESIADWEEQRKEAEAKRKAKNGNFSN
jgi:hypothetical protein